MMIDPMCYKMIKEKVDGVKEGNISFPKLMLDQIYLMPQSIGAWLVREGFAIPVIPETPKESTINE